jgi:hypothetical protein
MLNEIEQWSPEVVDKVLEMSERINKDFFPFSLLIPVVLVTVSYILIFYCYRNPGMKSSNYLKVFLTLVYIISSFEILLGTSSYDLAFSLVGTLAMWSVSGLLLLDIYWNKTHFIFRFNEYRIARMLGIGLILTGTLIYPIVEILTGFVWPQMVLFGAECPTTIFLIGLFLVAIPRTNKLILAIITINAVYTGGSCAIFGFPPDFLYAFAGVTGLITLIYYWRDIRFLPLKQD